MIDLVKHLRASFEGVPLCGKCAEAADEIERLRAALKRLEEIYATDRVVAVLADEIEAIFDKHLHSSED